MKKLLLTLLITFTLPLGALAVTSVPWSQTNLTDTFIKPNNVNGLVMGIQLLASSTLQRFTFTNATGTSATTTNFFSTTASTTNFFGAGLLSSCNGTGFKLTYTTGGRFLCEVDQSGGGGGAGNSKWATSTDTTSIYPNTATKVGIGTTTPQWLLQLASSTAPQLTLTDGAGINHWSVRNAGGFLYFATSSPSTFATSSVTTLTINPNGNVGVGTTTPTSLFQLHSVATTTMSIDSNSTTRGSCIEMKDTDGVGYTYITANNGVLTASVTSCK